MTLLLYLFRRSRLRLTVAVLAGGLSGLCHVLLLARVNKAAVSGTFTAEAIAAFVGLCLVLPLTRVVSQRMLARISQDATFDLRLQLCERILAAPLRALESAGIARLLSTLTTDVITVGSAFTIFPILCTQVVVLLASLIYLGFVAWQSLLVALLGLGCGVVGFRWCMVRARRAFHEVRQQQDELQEHFRALTEGIKELKVHRQRRAEFVSRMLMPTCDAFRQHNLVAVSRYAAGGGWAQMVQFALLGIVTMLPSAGLIGHEAVLPSLLVLVYITSPIDVLSSNLPTLGRAAVALDAIDRIGLSLEEQSTEREPEQAPPPCLQSDAIELCHVTHDYRGEDATSEFVFGPIDLTLRPGELVFVVGGNGSGKTTLAKFLTGLYAPKSGMVRVAGVPVSDDTRDDYRQMFAVVFSDCFLFERLVGLHQATDEQAARYLALLRLDSIVNVRDGALSTTALSRGQRKRLSLLVAYLEDRPIYLFDEWAADQDPVFKRLFYCELLPDLRSRGKTVVAITHDDAYYSVADRIIKLDSGRVVYDGPAGHQAGEGSHGVASLTVAMTNRARVLLRAETRG